MLLGIGIVWWAPTPATRNPVTAILLAILLAILIAIGFEGLRRRTAREFPDADRKVAEQHGRERLARATASVRQWAGAARTASNGSSGAPPHDERFEQLERLGRLQLRPRRPPGREPGRAVRARARRPSPSPSNIDSARATSPASRHAPAATTRSVSPQRVASAKQLTCVALIERSESNSVAIAAAPQARADR